MNPRNIETQARARSGVAARGLALVLSMAVVAGCESALEVELPGQITPDGLYQPGQAALLVNSSIAHIECAYSDFIATQGSGGADVYQKPWFFFGTSHEYEPFISTAQCNTGEFSWGWWSWMQAGRFMGEQAYESITGWTAAEVQNRERLLAQAALYSAIPYGLIGEVTCEASYEGGPLMAWDESLAKAEEWLTKSLQHINTGGDFALANGISSSAKTMATALRARYRFARGDLAGAVTDAAAVPTGFRAYISRDAVADRTRQNRVNEAHHSTGLGTIQGPITWWSGPPDPNTGQAWPAVIPFTGYQFLAISADGRAVTEDRYPITSELPPAAQGVTRRADPSTVDPNAVKDPRVDVFLHEKLTVSYPWWQTRKYRAPGEDMTMVSWEEMRLIQAEIAGGQGAIDRVNEIRTAYNLPPVTYANPGNATQIKNMLIEENRRSLFLEGTGFYTTKLRHNLWFPRGVGFTPGTVARGYQGGVRMVMPDNEFELNENFDMSDRATHCPQGQALAI